MGCSCQNRFCRHFRDGYWIFVFFHSDCLGMGCCGRFGKFGGNRRSFPRGRGFFQLPARHTAAPSGLGRLGRLALHSLGVFGFVRKGRFTGRIRTCSTFAIFSGFVAETGISLSEADCGVFSSAAFVSGAACSSSGTGFVMGHSGTSRDGHSAAGAVVSAVVETEGTQLRGWASPSDGLRCKYLGTPSASFSTGRWDSGIYSDEGLSSTAFLAGDPSIGLCQRG